MTLVLPSILLFAVLLFSIVSAMTDVVCKPGNQDEYELKPGESLRLRTLHYPNPYQPYVESYSLTLTPPEGFNIVFLLEQFLLDPHDEMEICDSTNICQRAKFDQTDHRGTSAFYESSGKTSFSVKRSEDAPKPSMPHTGFSLYVKTYKITEGMATDCLKNIDLNDNEPLTFVLSPNYPNAHEGAMECNYSIRSRQHIRVLAFEFNANFALMLKGADGRNVTLHGHPTSDQPLPYYFNQSVDISFSYPAKTGYRPPQFFFVVEQFTPRQSTNDCLNTEEVNLSEQSSVDFGTPHFGVESYADNLDCTWTFYGAPPGYRMTLDFHLETEHCCDILNITGFSTFPGDYRGDEQRTFGFAANENVSLVFTSDAVGTAVGFKGTASYQDCQCDENRVINMGENSTFDVFSAGYHNNMTYCPRLNCSWKVVFPENYVLSVNPIDLDLRYPVQNHNTIDIKDIFNRTINSFNVLSSSTSSSVITNGVAYITFTADATSIFYFADRYSRGFHLRLSLSKMDLSKHRLPINLSYDQRTQDIKLDNIPASASYIWTVAAPPNAPVFFYMFWKASPDLHVDLFDGSTEFHSRIDTSLYYKTETISGAVPSVQSTTNALTIRVFAKRNIDQFKAVVSIGNYDLEGCPDQFLYAATKQTVNQKSFKIAITPPKKDVMCQFLIASSKYSTTERDGIYMTHFDTNAGLSVYKHVYTNKEYLLADSAPFPQFVFDDYITVAFNNRSQPNILEFNTQTLGINYTYHLKIDSTGLLFSPDFLEQSEDVKKNSATEQRFILESNSLTTIKIEVLRPPGNGIITLAARDNDGALRSETMNTSNYSKNISYNATNVKITYRSSGGTGGMFLKYTAVKLNGTKKIAISPLSTSVCQLFIPVIILVTLFN